MRKEEYEAVRRQLTAPGAPFEVVPVEAGGRMVRGWRNAPSTLREILERGQARGDAVYIQLNEERISFAEHHRLVARCARTLQDVYNIRKGDRVAIAMRNLPEWSIAFWAVIAIGGVAVSINAWMTGPEMAYCITDSGSRILIADPERVERLSEHLSDLPIEALVVVREDGKLPAGTLSWAAFLANDAEELPDISLQPGDAATILYTSGTTGRPKGALGSHRASCHNSVTTRYFVAVERILRGLPVTGLVPEGPAGCFLLTVPLFHGAGCQNGLIFSMVGGEKLLMMPRWDAAEGARLVREERVTELAMAPTHYVQLADLYDTDPSGFDFTSVRAASVGGASPPADLPARMRAMMPNAAIGSGYGQTECTQIAAFGVGNDLLEKPKACGRPIPITEYRIIDDEGRDVLVGETGELLVRLAAVVDGYINRPQESAETFVDGWLHTGDLVHIDEDDLLFLDDRKKDMLIRGGENIYSIEVEQALYSHADVVEAAVFGMPHPSLGEEPVAVVHLRAESMADEAALRAHAAERIAKFKVPVWIRMTPEPLPRNANGKILKRELRAQAIAETDPPATGGAS